MKVNSLYVVTYRVTPHSSWVVHQVPFKSKEDAKRHAEAQHWAAYVISWVDLFDIEKGKQ